MKLSKEVYAEIMVKQQLHQDFLDQQGPNLTTTVFHFLRDNPRDFIHEEFFAGTPVTRARAWHITDLAIRFWELKTITNKELENTVYAALNAEIAPRFLAFVAARL